MPTTHMPWRFLNWLQVPAAGIHVPIYTHKREEEIFKAFNFLFFFRKKLMIWTAAGLDPLHCH